MPHEIHQAVQHVEVEDATELRQPDQRPDDEKVIKFVYIEFIERQLIERLNRRRQASVQGGMLDIHPPGQGNAAERERDTSEPNQERRNAFLALECLQEESM